MPSIGPKFKGIDWQPSDEKSEHAGKPGIDFKNDGLEYTYPSGRQVGLHAEDLAQFWTENREVLGEGKTIPGWKRRRELEDNGDFYKRVGDFLEPRKPETLAARHASDLIHMMSSPAFPQYHHFVTGQGDAQGMINYQRVFDVGHIRKGNPFDVAIGFGNPQGSMDAMETFQRWVRQLDEIPMIPALIGDAAFAEQARQNGFQAIPIGQEAKVSTEPYGEKLPGGKTYQSQRSALNRFNKEGWQVRNYEPKDWKKVQAANDEWLKQRGGKEIGLCMGRVTPEYLESTHTRLLFDKDDNLLAFINTFDIPAAQGRGLDLMRYAPGAPGYALDALIIKEMQRAKQDGKGFFDLSLSPLADLQQAEFSDSPRTVKAMQWMYDLNERLVQLQATGEGDSPKGRWARLQRGILRKTAPHVMSLLDALHANYSFKGLHRYKQKYQPDWEPRYLIYRKNSDLPKVTAALARAAQ